jgi:zinc/manganese transport system substrate-binding protein
MKRRTLLTGLALVTTPAFAATKLKTVATFSVLGDLVREVGGDAIEPVTLVGPDTDVHNFQPTPREARVLASARLLVTNGLGFEGWLDRLAEAASFRGAQVVATTGLPATDDPHCWHDVSAARRYVANIASGLAASDAAQADSFRTRAAAYDRKLSALDSWVRIEIAKVPEAKRRAIVGHRAFTSFARAYGVELLSLRSGARDDDPSARDVADLIRLARRQNIKAVFVENLSNPTLVAEIARDIGVKLGPPLYSDALSKADGPAATYEAMMRYNVATMVAGMMANS